MDNDIFGLIACAILASGILTIFALFTIYRRYLCSVNYKTTYPIDIAELYSRKDMGV